MSEYTFRLVGTTGCEIVTPDGSVIAWTADTATAAISGTGHCKDVQNGGCWFAAFERTGVGRLGSGGRDSGLDCRIGIDRSRHITAAKSVARRLNRNRAREKTIWGTKEL